MASIMGAKLPVLLAEIAKIKPQTYIEIGCYQCDTMHEVHKLGIAKERMFGFDLFEQAPDHEEAPLDGLPISYDEAKLFGYNLHKGDTKDTLHILRLIEHVPPTVVFIDGGHSFETTLNDIEMVQKYIPDAILLMDDISMHGVALAMKASGLNWVTVGLETARVDL